MYRIYVTLNACLRLFKVVDDLKDCDVFFVLVDTCSGRAVDGKWKTEKGDQKRTTVGKCKTGKYRTTTVECL